MHSVKAAAAGTERAGKIRKAESLNPKLMKACTELESLFIGYMMKEMRNTIPKTGLIGGSKAEEIYTGMLDAHMAQDFSKGGGIGLAEALFNQLESTGRPVDGYPGPEKQVKNR
jgi:flagellar protein FlgJ